MDIQEKENIKAFFDNIVDLLLHLLRGWKIIVLLGFTGALIGLIASIVSKTYYNANLSFIVEEEKKSGLGQYNSIASQFGLNGMTGAKGVYSADNLIEYLRSRSMIEKTLLSKSSYDTSKLLIEQYIAINNLNEEFESKPNLKNLNFQLPRDKFTYEQDSLLGEFYINIFNNDLLIDKADKKIDIITITLKSLNQKFAKDFVVNLITIASDSYISNKTEKARENVATLQHRVDSIYAELNSSIYGRALSVDQNFMVVRQKANVNRARQEINVQTQSAMYTELLKNLELAKFNLMNSEPLIQIIDKPILPLAKEKLSKTKGLVLGGIFGGFISIFALILIRIYRNIYN